MTANTYELIGFIGKGVTMYATVRGDPAPGEGMLKESLLRVLIAAHHAI